MHMLVVLMSALLLTGSASAGIYAKAPDGIAEIYFELACDLSELDCEGIKPPTILAIDTPPRILGLHYHGTNVVFVTSRCFMDAADLVKCDGVVVHEIVHYIFDVLGERAKDDTGCTSEAIAWKTFNKYVESVGRPDLIRRNWQESYPRCRP